jgi:hypothetical protein
LRLRAFPPDLPVIVNAKVNELANGRECERVEQLDQLFSYDEWRVDYFPELPLEDGERRRQAVNVTA